MRQIKLVGVIFMLAALIGCSSTPPQVVKLYPPEVLTQDCEHPSITYRTNGELAQGIIAYRKALELCNDDKRALRAWSK